MKVTGFRTFVVHAQWRNLVFVRLETDEGITGLGEGTTEWNELAVEGALGHLCRRILGQDPLRVEAIWEMLYRDPYWRGGVDITSALSAIDQALWDIKGKKHGLPVYELLGGRTREKVKAYANAWYGGCHTPADFARQARETTQQGYTALKWDPFGASDLVLAREVADRAVEIVAAVREAVGKDVELMIEAHGRFSPTSAIAIARRLQRFDIHWFEEPIPPDNVAALAKVAAAVEIPIATGERAYTKFGFRELLERQVADVIQPDICHAGGITEMKKIAAMAETYYVPVAPHNPNGPVSTMATLHFDAAIPNFLIQEHLVSDAPWVSQLVRGGAEVRDGYFTVPDRPGLGVELDEQVAAAHPYRDTAMNLFSTEWEENL
ncbi:MAG: galactonate dehydratase [Chloroflexota bacterium]